jgi:lysophospholipase L1-like esterase
VQNKTFRWQSRNSGEFDTEVRLNNLGFRNDKDFDANNTEGKKLILALGDSTTAAFENSYENSYPNVLNQILGEQSLVLNAGVRGFDTNQVIIQYQTQLQKLQPDALVYMICENDLEGNINAELYPQLLRYYGKGLVDTADGSFDFIEPVTGVQKAIISVSGFMAQNFQISFEKIYMPLNALFKKHEKSTQAASLFDEAQQKRLEELLLVLNAMSLQAHIPLYITWFPYLAKGKEQNSSIPLHYEKTKRFVAAAMKDAVFIPTYEPLMQYYSLQPSTAQTQFLLPHDPHASEFGSLMLGRLIGEEMKKELQKRKAVHATADAQINYF